MWLGEPQADPNLIPNVAGKSLFKTKIGIIFKDFENFEKYFGNFQELFRKVVRIKSFRKFWTSISESYKKYYQHFWKLVENSQEKKSVNFKDYYGEFRELFRGKILINI